MMAEDVVKLSASEQKKEDWMNAKWRPMMGWMYMLVCTMDFVVFPILWSLLQAMNHGRVETQWSPITLQGAGLFHMAMGAIIGVAAFGRTQEKLAGVNNGGSNTPPSGFTTPSVPSTGFGATTGNVSSPTSTSVPASSFGGGFGSTPATTANGKLIVPQGPQPEL
jgi:hypothetical protein